MTTDSILHFGFHHSGVSVADLDRAIAWYERILGFSVEKRFLILKADAEAAMLRKGNLRMELFMVNGAAALPDDRRYPNLDLKTQGNKHVAFRIDDLDSFVSTVEEKGADIAFIVRESFGRACFIRDDTGNLIEFVEEKTQA